MVETVLLFLLFSWIIGMVVVALVIGYLVITANGWMRRGR